MVDSARALLGSVRQDLLPAEGDNRLIPLIEQGRAPESIFGLIAAEEKHIVASDWRSFLTLAGRADEPTARALFSDLAQGENLALSKLDALANAAGWNETALREYEPLAGCQAYPAYLAWLAINGSAADVIVAVLANFAAWTDYCSRIARSMRTHYGFTEEACGFFDLFAEAGPDPTEQAVTAVQAGLDSGDCREHTARRYARLFQSYEIMFWNTLADRAELATG